MTTSTRAPHRTHWPAICMAAALVLAPHAGRTAELDFRYWGTIGLSCFGSDDADYTLGSQWQPVGPGRSRRCDAGLDSVLGAHLDTQFNSGFSSGLQISSYRDALGDFTPKLTQANLRWQSQNGLTVSVGRSYNPSFMHSEYRNVHYTLTTARPPPEVYSLLEAYTSDGLLLLQTTTLAGWELELQAAAGAVHITTGRINGAGTDKIHGHHGMLAGFSAKQGSWLTKANVVRIKATLVSDAVEYNQLFDALNVVDPAAAQALALVDKTLWLASAGFTYDSGSWLAEGEYAYRTMQAGVRDQHGAYVIAGRHFGALTPYVGFAARWTAPSVTAVVPGLQAGIDQLLNNSRNDRTSIMLGVSRELGEKAILKLQVDRVDPARGSYGLLNNHIGGQPATAPKLLFSANLNFLF
jgi:hypothetical protein